MIAKKSYLAALIGATAAIIPVLAKGTETKQAVLDIKTSAKEELVAMASANPSGSSDFAMKLFAQSTKYNTGVESRNNILISPFSAYAALSMTLNGSAGKTRDQMAKVLGTNSEGIDALNKKLQSEFAALSANNDKVKLEIANAVYADSGTPFKSSFIDLCKQYYGAQVQNVDFRKPETLEMINSWCDTKTHGKITKILDKLLAREKMVLLNAVYFKGKWERQFKTESTQDDKFRLLSGERVPIKMMHQSGQFSYLKGQNFQALSLPYAEKKQSLYLFLPNDGVDLPGFCGAFTTDNWKQWMTSFHSTRAIVSLPKFTVNFSTELSSALKVMGMEQAFAPAGANFSNMIGSGYRAWISRVLQKTYMDVNEEGTEAAAVTAVVVATRRAVVAEPPPVQFRVDHPFVLALTDNDTGEILFLGLILEPTHS